jgi:hypothetical protein
VLQAGRLEGYAAPTASKARCKHRGRSEGPVFIGKPQGVGLLEWLIRTETAKVASGMILTV